MNPPHLPQPPLLYGIPLNGWRVPQEAMREKGRSLARLQYSDF